MGNIFKEVNLHSDRHIHVSVKETSKQWKTSLSSNEGIKQNFFHTTTRVNISLWMRVIVTIKYQYMFSENLKKSRYVIT